MAKSPFEPCIPTPGSKVPDRPELIHEIKHDGYRLIIQRDGRRVRLWSRNGHDWSNRFPLLTEAAPAQPQFIICDRRRSRAAWGRWHFRLQWSALPQHDAEVQLYAFDILVSDGEDLRNLPLSMRKTSLARLLTRRVDGITARPQLAKADTAFHGASVGQPTEPCLVFGRRAFLAEQEGIVDLLDVDAATVLCLDAVGDLRDRQ
jgi:bifunctional non-homologous end joining protein LigD